MKFCRTRLSRRGSERTRRRVETNDEPDAALRRHRRELLQQRIQEVADVELRDLGAHAARVEARDVEQSFQQLTGGGQRVVDALGEPAQIAVLAGAAAQRGVEQPRGAERLQQIVARGDDEARLRLVRLFGLRHRGRKLTRALFDSQLERLVDFAQAFFVAFVAGDVAERGDEAAVGQRLAAQLDDAPIGAAPLRGVCGAGAHVRKTLAHLSFDVAGPAPAALALK